MIVAIHRAYLSKNPAFMILFDNQEPSSDTFIAAMTEEIGGKRLFN